MIYGDDVVGIDEESVCEFADLLFKNKYPENAKKWYEVSYKKGLKKAKIQFEIIDFREQFQNIVMMEIDRCLF